MIPKTCYLVNPLSGNYLGTVVSEHIERLIRSGQLNGEVRALDFSQIDSQLSDVANFQQVVIAGGDGSIAAIIQFLANQTIPLGLIPLGTANDLAREMSIPRYTSLTKLSQYLLNIQKGACKKVQIWQLSSPNHSCFFSNYVSFGFTGQVVNEFSKWRGKKAKKNSPFYRTLNRIQYGLIGLKNTLPPHLLPFDIQLGNQKLHMEPSTSILFTNIQSYLGIGKSNRVANAHETLLYVLLTNSPFNYFSMIFPALALLSKPSIFEPATKAIIQFDQPDLYYQIDGEPFHATKDLTFEITPAFQQKILVA